MTPVRGPTVRSLLYIRNYKIRQKLRILKLFFFPNMELGLHMQIADGLKIFHSWSLARI
jgi:hypothetical protein